MRYRISCDQCEALVINGVPCHEHGCPNAKLEDSDGFNREKVEDEDES
jgi:hypothetical protein